MSSKKNRVKEKKRHEQRRIKARKAERKPRPTASTASPGAERRGFFARLLRRKSVAGQPPASSE